MESSFKNGDGGTKKLVSRGKKTAKSTANRMNGSAEGSVEGVFRIVIQRSLKEMVDLPELRVWNMLPRTILSKMLVRVRRYGFFFSHDSDEVPMRCVLTRRNYLIIYAKEKLLKGFALKLSLAEKISTTSSRSEKGRSMVNIKWRFGEICLTMTKEQIVEWRPRILEAFEGIPANCTKATVSSRAVGVQTDDYSLQCVENDVFSSLVKIPENGGCRITELPNTPPTKLNIDAVEDEGYDTYHNVFSSFKSSGAERSVGFASDYQKVEQKQNPDESNRKNEPRPVSKEVAIPLPVPLLPINRTVPFSTTSTSDFTSLSQPCRLLVPRRAVNRIERPLRPCPMPDIDAWFTLVKRYDPTVFPVNGTTKSVVKVCGGSNSRLACLQQQQHVVPRNNKKKIDNDGIAVKAVIGGSCTSDGNTASKNKNKSNDGNVAETTRNADDEQRKDCVFWRRRFFESYA